MAALPSPMTGSRASEIARASASVSILPLSVLGVPSSLTPVRMTRPVSIAFALQCQLDQAVDQFAIGDAAGTPQLRIHADRRKAGDGVELVEIYLPGVLVEEEIHARHARRVDCLVSLHSQLLDPLAGLRGQGGGNDQPRRAVYVLRLIGI